MSTALGPSSRDLPPDLQKLSANDPALTTLQIVSPQLSAQQISDICSSLRTNTHVRTVNLSANGITDCDVACISAALHINKRVKNLLLFGNEITYRGAKYIAEMLKKNKRLESLDLGANSICERAAAVLSSALSKNSSSKVKHLLLGNNVNIGERGCLALSSMLMTNHNLRFLSLNNNNLGDNGAALIASALAHSAHLLHLNIADNNISDLGGVSIARSLILNRSLVLLNLGANKLGDQTASEFARAFLVNDSLTSIFLYHNYVREDGAGDIVKSLIQNKTLMTVDINDNSRVGRETREELEAQLKKNLKLRKEQQKQIVLDPKYKAIPIGSLVLFLDSFNCWIIAEITNYNLKMRRVQLKYHTNRQQQVIWIETNSETILLHPKLLDVSILEPAVKKCNPRDWEIDQVLLWLHSIGMSDYAAAFRKLLVRGSVLLGLSDSFLRHMGVVDPAHIKKLRQEIEILRNTKIGPNPKETPRASEEDLLADYQEKTLRHISDLENRYSSTEKTTRELRQELEEMKKKVSELEGCIDEERLCVICLHQNKNIRFSPCGHVCCCQSCSRPLRECPLCRSAINDLEGVFL